ncbi:MAG: hypothetical protein AAF943_12360 [Pseudomonadota bacterium]
MKDLEAALLAAHAAGDAAALVSIYQEAAALTEDGDAAAFMLTHAHIFALECDHPDTAKLRAALVALGRESPLHPPQPPKR